MSVRDRLAEARNRIVADPRFQRFAASFPLTRPIARRSARRLFDLTAGFVYSQILVACVRLGLLETLARGPMDEARIAREFELSADAAQRLLKAAAALGLVERRAGGWGLGMDGAALLGNPGVAAMVEHHALLYADLADPVALLRGGRGESLSRFWPYAARRDLGDGAAVGAYSRLMTASQPLVADDILDAYDVRAHRSLVDLAGGEGAFLRAAARRAPDLQLTLFDLPAVATRAETKNCQDGVTMRCVGGDLWVDAVPADCDLATLVRVLHDHDDSAAAALLRRLRAALAPGATLLVAEPMADGPDGARVGDAYFGFYFLAMGAGRARGARAIAGMLEDAGFVDVRRIRTRRPMLVSAVAARIPVPERQ